MTYIIQIANLSALSLYVDVISDQLNIWI